MQCYISPNLFLWRYKHIYILDDLRVRKCSANVHFWVNYFLFLIWTLHWDHWLLLMVTTHLVWMWKLLVVPVCSKSWIAAANTMANISSSVSQCCGRANQSAITPTIIITMIQHHWNEFQQLRILTCKLRPQAFSSYWLQTDVIFVGARHACTILWALTHHNASL